MIDLFHFIPQHRSNICILDAYIPTLSEVPDFGMIGLVKSPSCFLRIQIAATHQNFLAPKFCRCQVCGFSICYEYRFSAALSDAFGLPSARHGTITCQRTGALHVLEAAKTVICNWAMAKTVEFVLSRKKYQHDLSGKASNRLKKLRSRSRFWPPS